MIGDLNMDTSLTVSAVFRERVPERGGHRRVLETGGWLQRNGGCRRDFGGGAGQKDL